MKNKLTLLVYFLKKDLKARYAGSGLGMLWTLLMPLINILLFWFVFSEIMKARPYAETRIPYIYFLLSSFFFWLAFSEALLRAAHSVVENADMVKKVSFPNIVLPVTATLSAYVHHMVGFALFIVFFTVAYSFSASFLMVIPVLILQILFSLGLGMLFSGLLPYVRDLSQILGALMQGLFFLSPIIYSIEAIPDHFRIIFYLNPITYFASSYHAIILSREMPPAPYMAVVLFLGVASLAGGVYAFKKLRDGFTDVL